ncbi:TLD domain protein conserved [Leptomonas pyrrhocoris]|uniref:TLD domain protein conserved n=1 Tax=Leptomonas pyrrhocoris TaxID=157538 RepID=A0A0N0VCR6_LEPPY|nr:TLD domain protein conserved [Leptomonas pyrrhocoris]KPA73624.1 TLD domain protein conserved [Leptomonas pyrrhocoris]|eukprot:XP_015652063.1 TLD domain protein conserved [Leptomonas pyrrhocoris]
MELSASSTPAAAAAAAAAAASSSSDNSPASPVSPTAPLTDTALLQLSLQNAAAAVAAGRATVAANNYALVVKIFFRKCFLLEELVLLGLAMGYETHSSAQQARLRERDNMEGEEGEESEAEAQQQGGADAGGDPRAAHTPLQPSQPHLLLPAVDVDAAQRQQKAGGVVHTSGGERSAQLVDPLASVGMFLPPGLAEDDYDEERNYYAQKRQHQEELAHGCLPSQQRQRQSSSSAAQKPLPQFPPGAATSSFAKQYSTAAAAAAAAKSAGSPVDDVPGYDASTARWLACLLAKVHPDALPIATLEKLCKVQIPSRTPSELANDSSGRYTTSFAASPTSAVRGAHENNSSLNFPTSSSSAIAAAASSSAGMSVFSPSSTAALARLIPHLKSSPTSSSLCGNNNNGTASPTVSTTATNSPTMNRNDTTATASVFGTSSSSSLSLLFATLLWDVACALWNEGFVEDTHHWLSVMDVRRLWKLYGDSCMAAAGPETPPNASGSNSLDATRVMSLGANNNNNSTNGGGGGLMTASSLHTASTLYTSMEPHEEGVTCEERACALSWPAVLAECRAADESSSCSAPSSAPPPPPPLRQQQSSWSATPPATHPTDTRNSANTQATEPHEAKTADVASPSQQEQQRQQQRQLSRPRSGITLSAFASTPGPLPMTVPTSGVNDASAWPDEPAGSKDTGDGATALKNMGDGGAAVATERSRGGAGSRVARNEQGALHEGVLSGGEDDGGQQSNQREHEEDRKRGEVEEMDRSSGSSATATHAGATATQPHAIPMFVRRLARRTSALRDLCGLMMGCETAEDVLYVIFALHCALQTQQRKMDQLLAQQQQEADKRRSHTKATSSATPTTTTVSGGLAEVLVVANLLVEFFLAKRAQKILLEAGLLPSQLLSAVSPGEQQSTAAAAATARPLPPRTPRGEHTHRMDRAIRQACDEVVCAFTNGQCLTLYGLESYGIPTPHDRNNNNNNGGGGGGGSREKGSAVPLLVPELPYVLVSNVLSSALNFATLYRLSKVFHGVMGVRSNSSSGGGSGAGGRADQAAQCSACQPTTPAPSPASVFMHVNRTRKATEEEKLRRQRWTRGAPPGQPAARSPHPQPTPQQQQQQQQQQGSAQSVVGELFGFMKGAAASWRNATNFVHPTSAEAEAPTETPVARPAPSPRHDVRPSRIDPEFFDAPPLSSSSSSAAAAAAAGHLGGGYAERLANARRVHAERIAAADRTYEFTPWSALSPDTVTSNNSSLANASSISKTGSNLSPGTRHSSTGAPRKAVLEVQTSGPGACELLVPSRATARTAASKNDGGIMISSSSSSAAATAAAAARVSSFPISLLAEESERMGLAGWTPPTAGSATPTQLPVTATMDTTAGPADTVLYTPSAQLQSRTPSEAACLRLLALLYRYPQLHTLEPITASHVDLVAKELNKALHILQVAMRGRFGERWWRQWRARREGETQRYYARALADAQRGVHVRRRLSPAHSTGLLHSSNRGESANTVGGSPSALDTLQPPAPSAAAAAPSSITDPALASPTSAGVPSPVEPPPLSSTTAASTTAAEAGTTNVLSSDPSLVLRHPSNDSMQQPPPFTLQIDSPSSILQPPPQELSASGYSSVPPPSAPQPTPRQDPVLSKFWSTRTLSIPTQDGMKERRQNPRGRSVDLLISADDDGDQGGAATTVAAKAAQSSLRQRHTEATSAAAASASAIASTETAVVADDGTLIDVNWDVPPHYTPDVSLDFSAFTTTSVETQEATRQLVESLQRQQHDADSVHANVPGISLLSSACRRLLHDELPLLQQYCPWRVIYSTRMHGVSLGTLFANCRRESERHMRLPSGLFSLPSAMETSSSGGGPSSADARPMLLVLELPASTTLSFAEDDAGVREALAQLRRPCTAERAATAATAADYHELTPFNKLYVGAYLSDLLRLESRRYYGTQECFVFQLLVPARTEGGGSGASDPIAAAAASTSSTAAPPPQLHVFHATRQNTRYVNCRPTSIVIGGGGSGSSLYVDDSLSHGATSACATFSSPPLSVWHSAAATLCEIAGVHPPPASAQAREEDKEASSAGDGEDGRQHSLSLLNVEVIVMDA